MAVHPEQIQLDDDRTLAYSSQGDPDGDTVLLFHGTPGSHVEGELLHDAAVAAGVRVITPDRPGMGRSTLQVGRTLLDWPSDVEALADHLGLDRLRIIGYSGGGPYALACAARLAPRIDSVAVVSGCAPVDRPAIMVGSSGLDRILATLSVRSLPMAAGLIASMAAVTRRFPKFALSLANQDLTERERVAMGDLLARSARRSMSDFTESTRSGARGAAVDYRITSQPWGFLPEEVAVPVTFWHGDADDVVPIHHAQGLVARVPHARLVTVPGASHLAIRVVAARIVAELMGRNKLS